MSIIHSVARWLALRTGSIGETCAYCGTRTTSLQYGCCDACVEELSLDSGWMEGVA